MLIHEINWAWIFFIIFAHKNNLLDRKIANGKYKSLTSQQSIFDQ